MDLDQKRRHTAFWAEGRSNCKEGVKLGSPDTQLILPDMSDAQCPVISDQAVLRCTEAGYHKLQQIEDGARQRSNSGSTICQRDLETPT